MTALDALIEGSLQLPHAGAPGVQTSLRPRALRAQAHVGRSHGWDGQDACSPGFACALE